MLNLSADEEYRALRKYKNVSKAIPYELFYLANEKIVKQMNKYHRKVKVFISIGSAYTYTHNSNNHIVVVVIFKVIESESARHYCVKFETVAQFRTFTNVEDVLSKEIRLICGDNTEMCRSHLKNIEKYIETAFVRYVPILESWLWTVLREIEMRPSVFESDWLLRLHGMQSKCTVQLKVCIFFVG